jgi:hypothetical protein
MRAGQTGILRQLGVPAGGWCKIAAPLGLCSDTADEPLPDHAESAADMLVDFEIS